MGTYPNDISLYKAHHDISEGAGNLIFGVCVGLREVSEASK